MFFHEFKVENVTRVTRFHLGDLKEFSGHSERNMQPFNSNPFENSAHESKNVLRLKNSGCHDFGKTEGLSSFCTEIKSVSITCNKSKKPVFHIHYRFPWQKSTKKATKKFVRAINGERFGFIIFTRIYTVFQINKPLFLKTENPLTVRMCLP